MNQQIISAKKCSHFALMLHPYYSEVSSRQLTAPEPSTGKRTQGAYPIIHLLPGINEMSLVTTKQLINVHTAITGMAATVGNPNVDLNTDTHKPSQKMCIRNMP